MRKLVGRVIIWIMRHIEGPAFSKQDNDGRIAQFHGVLEDTIKEYRARPTNDGFEHPLIEGLEAALALYEGYFGYFGEQK